jgi:hypothetical protein
MLRIKGPLEWYGWHLFKINTILDWKVIIFKIIFQIYHTNEVYGTWDDWNLFSIESCFWWSIFLSWEFYIYILWILHGYKLMNCPKRCMYQRFIHECSESCTIFHSKWECEVLEIKEGLFWVWSINLSYLDIRGCHWDHLRYLTEEDVQYKCHQP